MADVGNNDILRIGATPEANPNTLTLPRTHKGDIALFQFLGRSSNQQVEAIGHEGMVTISVSRLNPNLPSDIRVSLLSPDGSEETDLGPLVIDENTTVPETGEWDLHIIPTVQALQKARHLLQRGHFVLTIDASRFQESFSVPTPRSDEALFPAGASKERFARIRQLQTAHKEIQTTDTALHAWEERNLGPRQFAPTSDKQREQDWKTVLGDIRDGDEPATGGVDISATTPYKRAHDAPGWRDFLDPGEQLGKGFHHTTQGDGFGEDEERDLAEDPYEAARPPLPSFPQPAPVTQPLAAQQQITDAFKQVHDNIAAATTDIPPAAPESGAFSNMPNFPPDPDWDKPRGNGSGLGQFFSKFFGGRKKKQ